MDTSRGPKFHQSQRGVSAIISAADATTANQLGGAALERTAEAMGKITDVIKYGLVNPHVSALYPLARAGEAIAVVEDGHATGKVVIEMDSVGPGDERG